MVQTGPNLPSAMLTNVPGPQQPVLFLGQEVAEMRFHAVANNFGLMYMIFSYNGSITATINVDPSIGDAEELSKLWTSEFEALYEEVMSAARHIVPKRKSRSLVTNTSWSFAAGAAGVALLGIVAASLTTRYRVL